MSNNYPSNLGYNGSFGAHLTLLHLKARFFFDQQLALPWHSLSVKMRLKLLTWGALTSAVSNGRELILTLTLLGSVLLQFRIK